MVIHVKTLVPIESENTTEIILNGDESQAVIDKESSQGTNKDSNNICPDPLTPTIREPSKLLTHLTSNAIQKSYVKRITHFVPYLK